MSSASPDPLMVPRFNLEVFKTVAEAQREALKAAGEAKKNFAEAALKEAEAEYQRIKNDEARIIVEMKRRVLVQYDLEWRAYLRDRDTIAKQIDRIKDRTNDVQRYARHHNLSPDLVPFVWMGFNFFLQRAPAASQFATTTRIRDDARSGSNFSYNRDPNRRCEDVSSKEQTLMDLVSWLTKRNYIPLSASQADLQITLVLQKLQEGAEQDLVAINEYRKKLSEDFSASWPAFQILTLPLTSSAMVVAKPPEKPTSPGGQATG